MARLVNFSYIDNTVYSSAYFCTSVLYELHHTLAVCVSFELWIDLSLRRHLCARWALLFLSVSVFSTQRNSDLRWNTVSTSTSDIRSSWNTRSLYGRFLYIWYDIDVSVSTANINFLCICPYVCSLRASNRSVWSHSDPRALYRPYGVLRSLKAFYTNKMLSYTFNRCCRQPEVTSSWYRVILAILRKKQASCLLCEHCVARTMLLS